MSVPHSLESLARELSVTTASLARLGVSRNGSAWRIPERDAQGEIIGHALRRDDGSKLCEPGSKRGLTMVWLLDAYAGTNRDEPVLVVEGMSDTAVGLDLGFVTVGRPSATGGLEHLRTVLRDRHVVVVGENDSGAGRTGAEKIAQGLADVAASVRVIFPPEGIKDLRAWFNAGATQDDLYTEFDAAMPVEPDRLAKPGPKGKAARVERSARTICLADVQPQPVTWLWPGRIAIGKLTIIAGDPGLGKSFVTLDIASRVSTGNGWPDAPGQRFEPGGVVLLNAEDTAADTIRPRLDAAGADVSRIIAIEAVTATDPDTGATIELGFDLATDLPSLEDAIARTPDCRLVIVDPITAYLGRTDSHKNAEVRGLLAPLSSLAARLGVAVVAVTHLNKSPGGAAIYRTMGSLAFAAAARAVWGVMKDKDDRDRRLMLPVKNNIGGDTAGMAFRLRPAGLDGQLTVAWEADPVTLSADEALAEPTGRPGPEPTEREEAANWLRDALAGGARPSKELIEEAREAESIVEKTLRRAGKEIGVVAYRPENPGPWWWRLPDAEHMATGHTPSCYGHSSSASIPADAVIFGHGGPTCAIAMN